MGDEKARLHQLTPHEQTREEQRAYAAWLKRREIYDPPPQPDKSDMVHENRRVMDFLTGAVGLLPALLAVVMLASIVVSLDKTAAAFHAAVANHVRVGGWDVWAFVVALAGVVMADAALVVAEFALVRDMLKKGLTRQVWTVKSFWRSIQVRLGNVPPLDYHEMPDPTLRFYSRFVFWLVLAANVYAVTRAGDMTSLSAVTFENGLLLFVGIAGALSLRFIGQQMAHIVYELMAERNRITSREMYEEWRLELLAAWEIEGPSIVAQSLHNKFLQKNGLPLDAGSPYLLTTGEEGELEIIPFESSSMPFITTIPNENGNGTPPPSRTSRR